jgi:acetyltransferase
MWQRGAGASRVIKLMSTYRLKNLLSPRSFALVGASPRQGSVGRAILQNTLKAKFKGEFGLVNPRYAEIDGVAAVGSLDKLPFVPELVVITAPAAAVPGIIDEAGKRALSLSVPGLGMARGRWRTRPNVSRRNMGCG